MLSLTSRSEMVFDKGTIVNVTTSLTFYRVVVEAHVVTIMGPGVREEMAREGILADEDLSSEALAAIAILLFEGTRI